ncbi:hypothetical protein [Candidatus Finniella inopinata]|uniref:Uncharacterized protein n=1 Tax=Candidatus Finniella inopinata TaxID=1696036 RepID=A0A4Q7DHV0_9PROT|nr:hypothetical protein [Candidatus Finniella inopinata]RZI46521.1 hypothetical protein EQU50_02745 [Candidatus Finniella inopinata]
MVLINKLDSFTMINTKLIFLLTIAFLGSSHGILGSDESSSSDDLGDPAARPLTFDVGYSVEDHSRRIFEQYRLRAAHALTFDVGYRDAPAVMAAGAPPSPQKKWRLQELGFLKDADQKYVPKEKFSYLPNLRDITPRMIILPSAPPPVEATFVSRRNRMEVGEAGIPSLPTSLVKEIKKFLPDDDTSANALFYKTFANVKRSFKVSSVEGIQRVLNQGLHFGVIFKVRETDSFNQIVPLLGNVRCVSVAPDDGNDEFLRFLHGRLNLPDNLLELFPSNPHLETLRIESSNRDPLDLAPLSKFPGLRALELKGVPRRPIGIFSYNDHDCEDLSFIRSLPYLTELSLSGRRPVTDLTKGLEHLQRHWNVLKLTMDKDLQLDLFGNRLNITTITVRKPLQFNLGLSDSYLRSLILQDFKVMPLILRDFKVRPIISTNLTVDSEGAVSFSIQPTSSSTEQKASAASSSESAGQSAAASSSSTL